MQNLLKVGLIIKPQGIKGELKVQPLTDDITRFKKLKDVLIDDKTYRVARATIGAGTVFVALSGVNDRDTAETFRGKFILVDRENAVELPKDNYFIVDIIGCSLVTDFGEKIGVITDVTSARTDIFTVKTEHGRTMRFPFLKDLLISVDVDLKTVTVKKQRLDEVSCYED